MFNGLSSYKVEAYQRLENNLNSFIYGLEKFINDTRVSDKQKKVKCDLVFGVISEISRHCVSPFQKDLVDLALAELRNYLPIGEDLDKLEELLKDPKQILVREVKKVIGEYALNYARMFFQDWNKNHGMNLSEANPYINHNETDF